MKLRIIKKKYAVHIAIQFSKKRFYDVWSSQRPPARVGIKPSLHNLLQIRRLSKISDESQYQRSFSHFYRRLSRSFKLKSDLRKQRDFRLSFILTRNLLAKIRPTCFLNVGDFFARPLCRSKKRIRRTCSNYSSICWNALRPDVHLTSI